MLQTLGNQPLQIVNALTDIREEWQTAARGASLLEVESNLGLLLVDILNHLNLPGVFRILEACKRNIMLGEDGLRAIRKGIDFAERAFLSLLFFKSKINAA